MKICQTDFVFLLLFFLRFVTSRNSTLDVAGVVDRIIVTDTFALHSWVSINLKPILTSYRNGSINSNGKEDGWLMGLY